MSSVLDAVFPRICAPLVGLFVSVAACDDGGGPGLDQDFDIPRSETFAPQLSGYGLFAGPMADLTPASDVHDYALSSVLFTDDAKKQRLVRLPPGDIAQVVDDRIAEFPEGTVVAKTFYYPLDFRDASLGQRILETRLMVLAGGQWNVATYIWNDEQTDATLSLDDVTTQVEWIAEDGEPRSTAYEIPGEVACISCHQVSDTVSLLGLTPRNLNRTIEGPEGPVNQLTYLQSELVFANHDVTSIAEIVDYNDTSVPLEQRARAYLDVNCSHCHNPDGWERPANENLDFRFETPLSDTGILGDADEIEELISAGEMPYIGTTILDDDGVQIVLDYLNTL